MCNRFKVVAVTSSAACAALCSAPAFAGGTAPGTNVANNITANYEVGGVAQPSVSASDTFRVDRKVNLSLIEAPTIGTTIVGPGQAKQASRFQLTNTSNDTLDFVLAATNLVTGTNAPHGGQDSFDFPWIWQFLDVNSNGIYEPAIDNIWYVDNLAPDQSRYVFVVVDVPMSATIDQIGVVQLAAGARDASGNQFNIIEFNPATDSTANGANTVETIFADVAKSGPTGVSQARDGVEKTFDDYTVVAPVLSVTKTSRVIDDYLSAGNPKVVPGALVEYCVSVTNAPDAGQAANVTISDVLPADLTYYANSIRVNLNITNPGQECQNGTAASDSNGDADGGSFATPSNTVQGSLGNLNGGRISALIYQATVK